MCYTAEAATVVGVVVVPNNARIERTLEIRTKRREKIKIKSRALDIIYC